MQEDRNAYVPWKRYVPAVVETIVVFTLASFLLGLYILHYSHNSIVWHVLAGLVYATVVIFTITRMVRKFSLAANMLMIPIAPFIILMIVVTLIHLLQYF